MFKTSSEAADLGGYHNLNLFMDVLLLADIFESFRDTCIEHYELDPVHNYTNPGLARNAALKLTGTELDLFADMDMNLFIEGKISGGVNFISHRFSKANVLEPM